MIFRLLTLTENPEQSAHLSREKTYSGVEPIAPPVVSKGVPSTPLESIMPPVEPVRGTARLRGGWVDVSLSVPVGKPPAAKSSPAKSGDDPPTISHSPDFCAVRWHDGTVYSFSGMQRDVIAALFRAREGGHEWVSQETLLELAESNCTRLRDLFRDHPAWGTVIESAVRSGGPPGSYRLAVSA